jgi:hypothetical protein
MGRDGFARLVDRLESGDVLIVTKLDRLGRNAMDVRATVERLAEGKALGRPRAGDSAEIATWRRANNASIATTMAHSG